MLFKQLIHKVSKKYKTHKHMFFCWRGSAPPDPPILQTFAGGASPTGGLVVFVAILTFHRKILCADRQYVTQNFDTKQAGRRIFEISVYRPGKFDAHTMTLRQDGGFSAERKMSQLATPQDLLPQDSSLGHHP